jgi:hypothetical protein
MGKVHTAAIAYTSTTFDANIEPYLPREPALTGQIAENQPPKPQKQAHTCWKAQRIFRGLSPKAQSHNYKIVWRARGETLSRRWCQKLEEKAKDYKVKNNAAVEDSWLHEMSERRRRRQIHGGIYRKCSQLARSAQESLWWRKCSLGWLLALAGELDLEAERVEPPRRKKLDRVWSWSWVVVGQQRLAVAGKVRSPYQLSFYERML